jgi:hypothetical protein
MGNGMNRSNKVRWSRRWGQDILLLALLFLVPASQPVIGDTGRPAVGSRLPSVLTQARLRNAPVGEPPAQSGWIVYAFSPLSPKSEANQKRVEELARSLPSGWVLLAVSTEIEGVSAFAERLRVRVPVLTQVPAATLKAYKVTSTPRTYVLDQDWKLLEVLDGPFEGKVAKKLAARFKPSNPSPREDQPAGGPGSPNLCRDRQQNPYSRGSRADALGVKLQCGPEGVWVPAS